MQQKHRVNSSSGLVGWFSTGELLDEYNEFCRVAQIPTQQKADGALTTPNFRLVKKAGGHNARAQVSLGPRDCRAIEFGALPHWREVKHI